MYYGNEVIILRILNFKEWAPLSRSAKIGPLLNMLTPEQSEALFDEFAVYLLALYKAMLIQTIKSQKFRDRRGRLGARLKPLSPKWKKYKEKHNLKKGFWQAWGYLLKNIEFWKDPRGAWVIGYRSRKKHYKSKYPLAKIALALELGVPEHNLPPRPVFEPIAIAMSKHIYDMYFYRFLTSKYPDLVKYVQ